MIGILSQMTGYEIQSNKEQGNGRPDIVLKPFSPKQPAIILELKRAHKFTQMEGLCDAALEQMEEKRYDAELVEEGYQIILKYGICFAEKLYGEDWKSLMQIPKELDPYVNDYKWKFRDSMAYGQTD